MNVAYQLQKIDILLAQNGIKTVLEKMPVSSVRSIEPPGVTGQKTPHDGGDRHGPSSKKKVKVVRNQRPCVAQGLRIQEDFSQSLQKILRASLKYAACPTPPDSSLLNGGVYS